MGKNPALMRGVHIAELTVADPRCDCRGLIGGNSVRGD
jgi:hypothetical protein